MWESRWPTWLLIVGLRPAPSTWDLASEDLSGRLRPKHPKRPSLLPARLLPPLRRRANRSAWSLLLPGPPSPRLRCPTGSLKAHNGKGGAASFFRSAPTDGGD